MSVPKQKILIVDDERSNINILVETLKKEYKTVIAKNGVEALTRATSATPPDLILLDIMMPEMDGYEVCRRLKADATTRDIPIIFITAMSEVEDETRGLELGAVDYITKPISPPIVKARVKTHLTLKLAREKLMQEQEKSERLLLNILPKPIAERLKQQEGIIADKFDEVTVLFADIVGFTKLSAQTSPTNVVNLLNEIFSVFDGLTERYGLEKIKTSGDDYMVVGGLPVPRLDHAEAVAEMALNIQQTMARFKVDNGEPIRTRIGINTGTVVAGVIGTKKFIYDVWGDTVNTAKRMESHGCVDCIQVTAETYGRLREKYLFEKRGAIHVKNKGEMISSYFLTGRC